MEAYGQAHAFRLERVGEGRVYLKYLRKTTELSGAQVLARAEELVRGLRHRHGSTIIELQDQSFVACCRSLAYDLGFRSLLRHGRTWYERQGYAPKGAAAARRVDRARRAMLSYSTIRVADLAPAVAAQVAALSAGAAWSPASPRLYTAAAAPPNPEPATRRRVLSARRWLLSLVDSAPPGATLGPWLSALPCADYARFMRGMYGDWRGEQPTVAVQHAAVATPTLREFARANEIRRFAYRTTWFKRV